ncbi:alpha/beta fold hydrolase [Streptomyces sp. GC420]|uniref:alpha/beta fold hydrolase n=1 Tax=Streptomyces sp. GC420 TaxID=2697568 RepID=UPI0014151097|nr:alpha/beta hydrolase [Streptomyces sp. GC420]NBM17253.1 alpha/beta fold hydrolase [Streptomyces sp. GC420]
MPHYRSYDDAELHYTELGSGPPLLCLAGGPGRGSAYLGDLGGLSAEYRLIVPDSRGTGGSPAASDPARYAFPAVAEDVESLREHLGLERWPVLAHDAGAATAQAYAAAHPQHLTAMVLVGPGSRLQGELPEDAREIFASRRSEPWWPDAAEAVRLLSAPVSMEDVPGLLLRAAPMGYARWEAPQRAHARAEGEQINPVPRAGFWQGVDDHARRALLERLREVECPVLVLTGELDALSGLRAGRLVAESFPKGAARTLPVTGHYPWVDDPEAFRTAVTEFLATTP